MASTKLSSLITCSLEKSDRGNLLAFAKMWHKETSSFHLPIEELTITLNDVASLLHFPITGVFHTFDAIDIEKCVVVVGSFKGVLYVTETLYLGATIQNGEDEE